MNGNVHRPYIPVHRSGNATSWGFIIQRSGGSPVHSSARVTRSARRKTGRKKRERRTRWKWMRLRATSTAADCAASRSHLLACGFRICCVQTRSVAAELCARLTSNRFQPRRSRVDSKIIVFRLMIHSGNFFLCGLTSFDPVCSCQMWEF